MKNTLSIPLLIKIPLTGIAILSTFFLFYSLTFEIKAEERSDLTKNREIPQHKNSPINMQWNIFGEQPKTNDAQGIQKDGKLIESNLVGILHNNKHTHSSVIMTSKKDDQSVFYVGDHLENQGEIAEIGHNHVLVLFNKKLYKIEIQKNSLDNQDQFHYLSSRSGSHASNGDLRKGRYQAFRALAAKQLGLVPVKEGHTEGYLVGEAAKHIKQRYNLKDNDIIVSANGYPLGTKESDELAFRSYKQSGQATFEIRRGDRILSISYP